MGVRSITGLLVLTETVASLGVGEAGQLSPVHLPQEDRLGLGVHSFQGWLLGRLPEELGANDLIANILPDRDSEVSISLAKGQQVTARSQRGCVGGV